MLSDNEILSAAYAANGGEIRVLEQAQVPYSQAADKQAYFNVDWCVFLTEADQLQLLLFYNNSTLEHLREVSRIGREYLPDPEAKTLPEAALSLLTAMRDFEVDESDLELMRICADGKVGPGEAKQFGLIIGQLEEIVNAAYEVRVAARGGMSRAKD